MKGNKGCHWPFLIGGGSPPICVRNSCFLDEWELSDTNTSFYTIYLIPEGKEIFQNKSSKRRSIYIKPAVRGFYLGDHCDTAR